MCTNEQKSFSCVTKLLSATCSRPHVERSAQFRQIRPQRFRHTARRKNMLGMIAVVLIVLWLLGFFAFHVTTAFIHVALIVGVILLVLHLMRGSTARA